MNSVNNRKTVLIADDDTDILEQSRLILESAGYSVVACTSRKEAEEYIAGARPDISVVDLMMETNDAGFVLCYHIKKKYPDERIVFIVPCIAKKNEAEKIKDIVTIDAVLTFSELRMLIGEQSIQPCAANESDFDPPHPAMGMIFPLGGGLLQASDLTKDLVRNNIISTEGNRNFVEVIRDLDASNTTAKLLDILCCEGCIMGPGMTVNETRYSRHERISTYARKRNTPGVPPVRDELFLGLEAIGLDRRFEEVDRRLDPPSPDIVKAILGRMGKTKREDELNCGACGYETCIEHAIAIHKGFAETQMCLPFAIDKFKETAKELSVSYKQLEEAQSALIQSEKLASMGQLAAGIAHEINNPLGVILLYTHLLYDKCEPGSQTHDDLKMIVEQSDRCKTIVGGLLNFARKNKAVLKKADIAQLVAKCVKAVKIPYSVSISVENEEPHATADIDVDQMMQVMINLLTNAAEAMPNGGSIHIKTEYKNGSVAIGVSDTGVGIKSEYLHKIFEPFFTTKQMGKGTGLGLAVIYGIIKMHRGNIEVTSNADPDNGPTGTTFTVSIPVNQEET